MEIIFDSDKSLLIASWFPGNSQLSSLDYIGFWLTLLIHVEVHKPSYLLLDASNLEYRPINEVSRIFSNISLMFQPDRIAIIESNHLLGNKSIELLTSLNKILILHNEDDRIIWINTIK
jgi:hypothetical protein